MLAQLAHRKRSLPEHAIIEELDREIGELDGRRIEAETDVGDLAREQKKADGEVELVRTRRLRDEDRMNSGQITNPKDLESMQHEIVALDRRISTLEDEELEVMERLETGQKTLDEVQRALDEATTKRASAEAVRDQALAELLAQEADVVAERGVLAGQVSDSLIALYDKVRDHGGGLGAAALHQRRCEGCRLEINGADLREIAATDEDEVLRCPECNRILVRTPESGL